VTGSSHDFPYSDAHHDLPIAIEFEENFLLAGLDPNDFGRPVDSGTHAKWHDNKDVASGGAFNKVWREFFRLNEDATAQQILAHLNRIRSGDTFRVVLSNGTSKDFKKTKRCQAYCWYWSLLFVLPVRK
jgi:hypothetical protein